MSVSLGATIQHARRSAANFNLNALLRGAQLTFVGAYRALQNPSLFRSEHYRQAALAVCIGLALHISVAIPILVVKASIQIVSFVIDLDRPHWNDVLVNTVNVIQHTVLQVPLSLVFLLNYLSPALDGLFMESLRWVDLTYYEKHANQPASVLRSQYYENLVRYDTAPVGVEKPFLHAQFQRFFKRTIRRTLRSLAVFGLAYVPYVGAFALPAATVYTFRQKVGTIPALTVFTFGFCLPKVYLVSFLSHYFASRSLTRELLEPYFARIKFNPKQRQSWFRDREGVLFGFGIVLLLLIRIPFFGVLTYGIAEASTAFLITKITDPPPAPENSSNFAETQTKWTNKHEFLKLPLTNFDAEPLTIDEPEKRGDSGLQDVPVRRYE